VPRIDGVVQDGWARRRATDSPIAHHDVEGLVTQLLLEEAWLQSSVQELARFCTDASREHHTQMGRAAWMSRDDAARMREVRGEARSEHKGELGAADEVSSRRKSREGRSAPPRSSPHGRTAAVLTTTTRPAPAVAEPREQRAVRQRPTGDYDTVEGRDGEEVGRSRASP
jgi:hypothetical protein